MRNDIITDEFINALKDYTYLLNRGYPRKSILKIVCDRYLLHAFQRILLSRGIFPDNDVQARIRKTVINIEGRELFIDTYNILFTICNYLLGRMVFIGNDRFVRDAGEVFGKLHNDPVLSRGIELCLSYLKKSHPLRVEFLLDSPISHSAKLAGKLRELLAENGLEGDAKLEKNPDASLIRQNSGIVATSDSDILENTDLPILDLAHLILKDNFELQLTDLESLLD
ncbi:DUF434 domain-containing protein [Bacteroidota bacterium]